MNTIYNCLDLTPTCTFVGFLYQAQISAEPFTKRIPAAWIQHTGGEEPQAWCPACRGVCEESTYFLLCFSPQSTRQSWLCNHIPRAWLSTPFHMSWLCSGNQWSYTARKLVKQRLGLTPWRGFSSLAGETILVHTFVNLVPSMSIISIAFDFKGV